jgi:hypothetical protein
MAEKAAKLGRDTSGVAVGQGPCVAAAARRDRGHQAAGLWSVWGDGRGPACLEALLAGMAKRGADKMRDRAYLIENREAAVGVQMFQMRQRWGAAVWRAQKRRSSLVG